MIAQIVVPLSQKFRDLTDGILFVNIYINQYSFQYEVINSVAISYEYLVNMYFSMQLFIAPLKIFIFLAFALWSPSIFVQIGQEIEHSMIDVSSYGTLKLCIKYSRISPCTM